MPTDCFWRETRDAFVNIFVRVQLRKLTILLYGNKITLIVSNIETD